MYRKELYPLTSFHWTTAHTENDNSQQREATPPAECRPVAQQHLIEIKNCEDMRPRQQLEAAKQQHADLSKLKGSSGHTT
eukprot:1153670-Pelagomonas_calceolata.AAC.2